MLFLCYPKCSTCQKAKAWLEERSISYDLRDDESKGVVEKQE